MTFSEKLIVLRKKKGMSQEQLAEQLDVSRQSVSKWEAHQALPETSKIILISNLFGVSIDLLLKDELSVKYDEPIIKTRDAYDDNLSYAVCEKCGKENCIDSSFCAFCGNPFYSSDEPLSEQTASISSPDNFNFKKQCANCGKKTGAFSKIKIAGKMFVCEKCVAGCSKFITPLINKKTIAEIKSDFARMKQYPEFSPTHKFGPLEFDNNNKLWKVSRYPVYKFSDIVGFDIIEQHGQSSSLKVTKITSREIDFFTQLGIRIDLNDINAPAIFAHFLNAPRAQVSFATPLIEMVNKAASFLNIILKNESQK